MNCCVSDEKTLEGPGLYGILVTYKRVAGLNDVLTSVLTQDQPLKTLLVVDNGADDSCEQVVRRLSDAYPDTMIRYVACPANLGPGGGTEIGMRMLEPELKDSDWLVRFDDDYVIPSKDRLRRTFEVARGLQAAGLKIGAVGLTGATYDRRRGRLRSPDRVPGRLVEVDYVTTGRHSMYAARAVRVAGPFRGDFFFGYTEAEYGLRLRSHGFRVVRIDREGWQGPSSDSPSLAVQELGWRRYYSIRNRMVLAREYGGRCTVWRVALLQCLAKPFANLVVRPKVALRALRLNTRAMSDAIRGQMGRRVEPVLYDGQLADRRSEYLYLNRKRSVED